MNKKNEWTQNIIQHCPIYGCGGMLLQNDYFYEHKCSDCGKYFIEKIEYVETKKPKE